jgi:glucokinase
MKILAGDIGGTNARLALCEVAGTTVRRDIQANYDSRRFESLADIAREFMSEHDIEVETACFGIPGPVSGRRARVTNLPWEVDADALERTLGVPSVFLLNDLEAKARGLPTLSERDFDTLRPGTPGATGNAGLIAAGTGLGEAGLYWDGKKHRPFACEGGHTSFAPGDDREAELLQWLRADLQISHVSWERVVSGPGLFNLYRFLRKDDPAAEPSWLTEELASGDPPAVVAKAARAGKAEMCRRALDWFMALYGAEAGNVALKFLATGGVYLGGGIAPLLADELPGSQFIEKFDAKGRMRPLLEKMAIRIVLDDSAAIQGAAYHASRRARGDHD